jgi:hypothetical protein
MSSNILSDFPSQVLTKIPKSESSDIGKTTKYKLSTQEGLRSRIALKQQQPS